MEAPEKIRCVECGGEAYLLTGFPPDEPPEAGDIVPYRCADCGERWDIVLEDEEGPEA